MNVLSAEFVSQLKNLSPGGKLWMDFFSLCKSKSFDDKLLNRLKIMGNIVNPTESALNSYIFSNALYPNFNKKPLLTRPQHSFNVQNIALQDFNNTEVTCIEIVLDMWDYMYTSRKVIDTVISYWPSPASSYIILFYAFSKRF